MNSFKKSLIVLSLVASSNANALGIGDIHLKSALNQNLNAEVSLVLAEDEKLTDVKVNLAPSAKFDELGIPWTQFLSSIKLQTIEKSNGHVVVKITSNEALKEPFLNFLLQVRSPKSNVFREFTVLVDPPEMQPERAVQKITPRVLPTTIDKPVLQKQPPKIVKPKTTVDTTVKPKKPKQSLELVAPSQENATKLNKSDTEQSVINQTLLNKIVELEKQIAQMQQLLQANKTLPEQPSIEKTPAVPVVEPVAPPVANSTAQSLIIVEPPPLTINEQVTANPEETVSESKPNKHRRTSTTKNSDDSFYYQAGGVTFGLLGLFWAWSRYKKPQILDKKEKIETVDSPSLKQETVEKSNEFVMPEGFIVEDNEAVNNKVFDTFQKDDFEDLKQDEIDPITYKIDIACAYNNFKEAEDLLKNAIQNNPEREDYRLKLLEIFLSNKDEMRFKIYANELKERREELGFSADFWTKLEELFQNNQLDEKIELDGHLIDEVIAIDTANFVAPSDKSEDDEQLHERVDEANFVDFSEFEDTEILPLEEFIADENFPEINIDDIDFGFEDLTTEKIEADDYLQEVTATNFVVDEHEFFDLNETVDTEKKIEPEPIYESYEFESDFDLSTEVEDVVPIKRDFVEDHSLDIEFDLSSFSDEPPVEENTFSNENYETVEFNLDEKSLDKKPSP